MAGQVEEAVVDACGVEGAGGGGAGGWGGGGGEEGRDVDDGEAGLLGRGDGVVVAGAGVGGEV